MHPEIIIKDLGNCYVDGVNVGQPADAILNLPALASAIQAKLDEFLASQE